MTDNIYYFPDKKLYESLKINVNTINEIMSALDGYYKYDVTLPKQNIDIFWKVLSSTRDILKKYKVTEKNMVIKT